MATHPVMERVSVIDRLLSFTKHPAAATAVLLLAIVAGGGGLAYAAEWSAPGDTLYGLKRAVNERLLQRLLPPEEWEARAVERRIAESVALTRRGAPRVSRRTLVEEVKQ